MPSKNDTQISIAIVLRIIIGLLYLFPVLPSINNLILSLGLIALMLILGYRRIGYFAKKKYLTKISFSFAVYSLFYVFYILAFVYGFIPCSLSSLLFHFLSHGLIIGRTLLFIGILSLRSEFGKLAIIVGVFNFINTLLTAISIFWGFPSALLGLGYLFIIVFTIAEVTLFSKAAQKYGQIKNVKRTEVQIADSGNTTPNS
jgi:hypothetical protein